MAHATCNRKTPEPRGLLLLRRVNALTGQTAQSRAEAAHPHLAALSLSHRTSFRTNRFVAQLCPQRTTSRRLFELFPLLRGVAHAVMVQFLGRRMQ